MNAGPPTADYSLALRFPPRAESQLRGLVLRLRGEPRREDFDPSLFSLALESVERNEPLVVKCRHPDEAIRMADAFPLWGIDRPSIDELTR